MHATEAMFLIISCVSICLTIFAFIYLKSRENLALIERGINPKEKVSQPFPFISLKYGLLLIGAGLGLFLAYIVDVEILKHKVEYTREVIGTTSYSSMIDRREPAIYFALIGVGGGIGLVLSYAVQKKHTANKELN